jgi:Type I phosphodiesterase / nucleotide pyrophosphatase
MKRLTLCLNLIVVMLLAVGSARAAEPSNVVLVVLDGVRWQEVFAGADDELLRSKTVKEWANVPALRAKYWSDDPIERRQKLMPFLWGTVARQGQLFGNQAVGSKAVVTNPQWFSYPGYNEMSVGRADPGIISNEFGLNPNRTVFEWLNARPAFRGRVEIFGSWNTFEDIFNPKRSGLPVRSGKTLVDANDRTPVGRLLRELYESTVPVEDPDPLDSFVHVVVRDHLKTHHPRVLFVGFGDTDNWAHLERYDNLLESMHRADGFIASLWQQLQSLPAYRGRTSLIITTDHGRGSGPELWRDHGVEEPGSENIWIGVLGPQTAALGERRDVPLVTQSQIAATVAAMVGEDYAGAVPGVAPPLSAVLKKK